MSHTVLPMGPLTRWLSSTLPKKDLYLYFSRLGTQNWSLSLIFSSIKKIPLSASSVAHWLMLVHPFYSAVLAVSFFSLAYLAPHPNLLISKTG